MRLLSTMALACCCALSAGCGDDDKPIDTPYAYAVPDAAFDDGGAGGAGGAGGSGGTGGMK